MKPDDVRQLAGVVDRAEERVLVGRQPHRRRALRVLRERRDEVVVDARAGQHAGGRGAVLAGVEVAGDGDALDGGLDVGVVEDHDRCLAAELEVDALDVGRGAGRDLGAGADRAGDGDQARGGVLDEHPAGVAVTGDDVERARGQELGGDLGKPQGGLGGGVARLEHHGVAGGQRRGDLPHGHEQRVVPGGDLADDADRLAPDPRGVALHVLTGGLALQHPGRPGEEPQLVDHRRDLLARRQRLDLAGVLGLERDELVGVRLDRVGDLQQRLLALARRGAPPLRERRLRRAVGRVDVGLTAHRGRGDHRTRGRVDDVGGGFGTPVDVLAGDEVAQVALTAHVRGSRGGWTVLQGDSKPDLREITRVSAGKMMKSHTTRHPCQRIPS